MISACQAVSAVFFYSHCTEEVLKEFINFILVCLRAEANKDKKNGFMHISYQFLKVISPGVQLV